MKTLGDEDIKNLCLTRRRPGGEVVNPQAGMPGQPPMIRNNGFSVSMMAEQTLLLCI